MPASSSKADIAAKAEDDAEPDSGQGTGGGAVREGAVPWPTPEREVGEISVELAEKIVGESLDAKMPTRTSSIATSPTWSSL